MQFSTEPLYWASMRYALLVVLVLVFAGCDGPATEEPLSEPTTDRLEFKMLSKEATVDECIAGADGCTYVRLDYPVLTDAPDGYAVSAVTNAVFSSVNAGYNDGGPHADVEALLLAFVDEYLRFRQRQPGYQQAWFLERKVFVLNNTPDLLATSLSERMYTGGAHPSATVTFTNMNPRTGERVMLSHVLVDGYEEALVPMAEARLRESREIEDGMSLADAGFTFFVNGAFALTENYSLGESGITFYYNPFDIAPYALGPTEIVLTYDELDKAGLLTDAR